MDKPGTTEGRSNTLQQPTLAAANPRKHSAMPTRSPAVNRRQDSAQCRTVCEREDLSLIAVALTVRCLFPSFISFSICAAHEYKYARERQKGTTRNARQPATASACRLSSESARTGTNQAKRHASSSRRGDNGAGRMSNRMRKTASHTPNVVTGISRKPPTMIPSALFSKICVAATGATSAAQRPE